MMRPRGQDPRGLRLPATGLSLGQLELEVRIDLPDLAHHPHQALLPLLGGLGPPGGVELQQLVLLDPQQLLLRALVDRALQVVDLALREALEQVQVLDGEASITIGEKELVVKAGEVVVMPANVPHALHAVQRFKMLLVVIKGTA